VLVVDGNPLSSLPPELTAQGGSGVLQYLRERAAGTSRQWMSKLLIVGEGGAGKTSLLRGLRGEPFQLDESTTHGIGVSSLDVQHPDIPEVRMSLRAWDFGGQDIYHATHQFFLSNRSLFIVVWNSRLGYEQGRLYYWLETIRALAPDSPVVLVATWTDERPADLPESELRAQFPQISDVVSVSNRSRDGFEELQSIISRRAAELPLMGELWPETWLKAADALRATPEKCLSPLVLGERFAAFGVTSAGAPVLLRWLHDLGELLHFNETVELGQLVVLKPQWLSEYVSRVLDSPEVIRRSGTFTFAEMLRVWSDLEGPLQQHFLHLMERFDLSYRTLEDRDVSLVVERLPLDPPDYHALWNAAASGDGAVELRMVFKLGTLPAGVPTWFIARAHRFTTGTHWRTGALLAQSDPSAISEQNGSRQLALVQAFPHRRELHLAVRGSNPQGFFALLKDGIELVLARFPGLDIQRVIPCPGHSGQRCVMTFDYDHLLIRYQKRRLTIECTASMEDVSVLELLFGWDWSTSDRVIQRLDELQSLMETDGGDTRREIQVLSELTQRRFTDEFRRAQSEIESYCPSVFLIRPRGRARWREKLQGQAVELHLCCEEPGQWHTTSEGGLYELEDAADWIRTVGPVLHRLVGVLRHVAPIVGPLLGVVDQELYKDEWSNDVALMKELVLALPDVADGVSMGEADRRHQEVDGASLRSLRALLEQVDPRQHWGGLRRVLTPEGRYLWLCDVHSRAYLQPDLGNASL